MVKTKAPSDEGAVIRELQSNSPRVYHIFDRVTGGI